MIFLAFSCQGSCWQVIERSQRQWMWWQSSPMIWLSPYQLLMSMPLAWPRSVSLRLPRTNPCWRMRSVRSWTKLQTNRLISKLPVRTTYGRIASSPYLSSMRPPNSWSYPALFLSMRWTIRCPLTCSSWPRHRLLYPSLRRRQGPLVKIWGLTRPS